MFSDVFGKALLSLQQTMGDCKSIQVLTAVAARLRDTDDITRQEAVKAVALLARQGDVAVIQAALACFSHDCQWAFGAGMQTLQLVGRGDAFAIAGLLQKMADPRTRVPAAQALLQIATMPEALRSCISCLESPELRSSVPESLAILLQQCQAPVGFVAGRLVRYLCHKTFEVRRVTLAALKSFHLAGKRIPVIALRGIGCRLLDRHQAVRAAATDLAQACGPEQRLRLLFPSPGGFQFQCVRFRIGPCA